MATSIKRVQQGERFIHPTGMHNAVCVDVYLTQRPHPFAGQTNKFGKVNPEIDEKLYIGFITDKKGNFNGEEQPAYVTYRVNPSFGTKSNLYAFLNGWLGGTMSEAEFNALPDDLDVLIGRPALVNVTHRVDKDKTYVDVKTATPLMDGVTPLKVPDGFVRHKDRKTDDERGADSIRNGDNSDII